MRTTLAVLAFAGLSSRVGCGLLANAIGDAQQDNQLAALRADLDKTKVELAENTKRSTELAAREEQLRHRIEHLEQDRAAKRAVDAAPRTEGAAPASP